MFSSGLSRQLDRIESPWSTVGLKLASRFFFSKGKTGSKSVEITLAPIAARENPHNPIPAPKSIAFFPLSLALESSPCLQFYSKKDCIGTIQYR